jgi:hypothetical protein
MTAPHGSQLLGAYVLDALDEEERRELETHLATCETCRAELEELEDVKRALDDVPPEALLHGPPDADLVLQRTLRQVRAEGSAQRRRGTTMVAAAAAIILAGAVVAGVAVGRGTAPAPQAGTTTGPTAVPTGAGSPSVSFPPNTKFGTATDPGTNAAINARIVPANGWVRVNATVKGVPAGENCRLIVTSAKNPNGEIAAGWVVPPTGETAGVTLDGAAAVAPADVIGMQVVNTAGKVFVTVKF